MIYVTVCCSSETRYEPSLVWEGCPTCLAPGSQDTYPPENLPILQKINQFRHHGAHRVKLSLTNREIPASLGLNEEWAILSKSPLVQR